MSNDPQPAVPPLQPPRMIVGYNYPWSRNDYTDFGPKPSGQKDPGWKTTLPRNLAALRAIGVKVVRWWILASGWTYGKAPTPFYTTVRGFPVRRWNFDPPDPVDPLFADHFEQMLKIFRQEELQVIPSLVDFSIFGEGPSFNSPSSFGVGGRHQLATDQTKRDVFLNTMVQALLDVSKNYRAQIFAWEVMNEPRHNLIRPSKTGLTNPTDLSESEMRTFLFAVLGKIEAVLGKDFPTTVGHRLWSDLSTLPTGNKHQFHYYGEPMKYLIYKWDPDPLPDHVGGDTFLGEFGSRHQGQPVMNGDQGKPWPECNGADGGADTVVFERLKMLAKKEYPLALIWPDLDDTHTSPPQDDILKLSSGKMDQVKKFTQGRFPNGVPT